LVRTRTVVLRKRPVRSLAYSRQAGGRGRLHIREHPKRTSTIKLKHIVDRDLAVSIILVDPKMAGPYISCEPKDCSDLRWRRRFKRPRDLSGEPKEDPEVC
jgi:hypothetical protein